jgi:hypothetical protein
MKDIKRGFAAGTNAKDAARKNHELGTAHEWTPKEARTAGQKGAAVRWGDRTKDVRDPPHR